MNTLPSPPLVGDWKSRSQLKLGKGKDRILNILYPMVIFNHHVFMFPLSFLRFSSLRPEIGSRWTMFIAYSDQFIAVYFGYCVCSATHFKGNHPSDHVPHPLPKWSKITKVMMGKSLVSWGIIYLITTNNHKAGRENIIAYFQSMIEKK